MKIRLTVAERPGLVSSDWLLRSFSEPALWLGLLSPGVKVR